MIVRRRDLLAKILDRVAEPGEQLDAVFLSDEVQFWPPDAIMALGAAKLLKAVLPANAITCRGCQERCRRPVTLIEAENERPEFLVSTCHLKTDFGPFEHSTERLKRWASSRETMAKFVSRSIGLSITAHDDRWRRVQFGALEIGSARRLLSVEFDVLPIAKIGSSTIPLIEFLEWGDNGIAVERSVLTEITVHSADHQSGSKRVQPSTTLRDDNKQLTKLKTRRLQGRLEKLAGQHPQLNKVQLAKKLEKSGEGEGYSATRILRVTRMPVKKSRRNYSA